MDPTTATARFFKDGDLLTRLAKHLSVRDSRGKVVKRQSPGLRSLLTVNFDAFWCASRVIWKYCDVDELARLPTVTTDIKRKMVIVMSVKSISLATKTAAALVDCIKPGEKSDEVHFLYLANVFIHIDDNLVPIVVWKALKKLLRNHVGLVSVRIKIDAPPPIDFFQQSVNKRSPAFWLVEVKSGMPRTMFDDISTAFLHANSDLLVMSVDSLTGPVCSSAASTFFANFLKSMPGIVAEQEINISHLELNSGNSRVYSRKPKFDRHKVTLKQMEKLVVMSTVGIPGVVFNWLAGTMPNLNRLSIVNIANTKADKNQRVATQLAKFLKTVPGLSELRLHFKCTKVPDSFLRVQDLGTLIQYTPQLKLLQLWHENVVGIDCTPKALILIGKNCRELVILELKTGSRLTLTSLEYDVSILSEVDEPVFPNLERAPHLRTRGVDAVNLYCKHFPRLRTQKHAKL